MRRQNHSCDYCRKSKKACDGYAINRYRYRSDYGSPSGSPASQPQGRLSPCSYCVRTKKQCSFNQNWGCAPSSPTGPTTARTPEEIDPAKRSRTVHEPQTASTLDYDLELSLDDLSQAIRGHETACSAFPKSPGTGLPDLGNVQPPGPNIPILPFDNAYGGHDHRSQPPNHDIGLDSWTDLIGRASPWDTLDMTSLADQSTSQESQVDYLSCSWDLDDAAQASTEPTLSTPGSNFLQHLGKRKTGRRGSEVDDERSLSVYSTDYMISTAANNNIIIGSLLGIYHDVLENNLACWLAEENCPYKMRRSKETSSTGKERCSTGTEFGSFQRDGQIGQLGGRNWSNRIYRRVTQLDRMAVRSRNIKLSRAQSQAASRALSLVIMAFATQWSQARRKQQSSHGKLPEEMNTDFERHLQQSVWQQAKQALQDVADVESFRVAYAEMVFGLMEKPWDEDDEAAETATHDLDHDAQAEAMKSQVLDMLAQDGPPVMLERAARKMQVLKFRFETNESLSLGPTAASWSKNMSDEDRETVGLLYWLAVMFDTVSAPMNERPVALNDEDCQHDGHSKRDVGEQPTDSRSRLRWNVQLFTGNDQNITTGSLYWPCSYEVAASAIARSAPIKILIFRHLSYLQNILRRKEFGQPVEDALWEATLVYRYWNTIYAPLYRDLVHNYETVPTRLRAWFVCIYIPWHLACLMLADVVELVEQNKLGLAEHSSTRVRADMVSRIRKQSAYELSELARVTAPGDGVEQLPDYHHAVNEGPLLTEPWTVLLVRAFSKAALYYLGASRESEAAATQQGLSDNDKRAEYCIKALHSLGRKSTMARQISKALYRVLRT